MNLLTNAVKYTESGTVTLRVKNNGTSDGNVKLRFDVVDTGIGIKDEDLHKLFESFERIEEKRNRHIEGTGLGISIVCKLLSMMNSKLDVESKYSIGSTFGFDLVLRIVDPEPLGNLDEKKKSASVGRDKKEHLYVPDAKVLVTDDNAMNLKVAANFLKIFGITPVTCSSGRETIEILKKEKFDIVLLDHMMPQMDGIETLKILRDENLLGGAAVIALTANAVVGAEEQYLSAGFDGYLSKPIMVDDIENTLKKYLPASGSDAPAAEISEPQGSSVSLEKARSLGLNTEAGIGFACGDETFYLELLGDFADSISEKSSELTSYLDGGDLENYEILVHSLKSGAKTIGADDLSEQAKALEFACKDKNADFVKEHHEPFIKALKEFAEKIKG
jgi:CheY-like chemotaxis protein/HPt (histidine-containing phosphotransfer) domain-containing protein